MHELPHISLKKQVKQLERQKVHLASCLREVLVAYYEATALPVDDFKEIPQVWQAHATLARTRS